MNWVSKSASTAQFNTINVEVVNLTLQEMYC